MLLNYFKGYGSVPVLGPIRYLLCRSVRTSLHRRDNHRGHDGGPHQPKHRQQYLSPGPHGLTTVGLGAP